jgi:hypothetical protein
MIGFNTVYGQIEQLPAELAGRILCCRSMAIIRALTRANVILFIIGICLAIFSAIPHEFCESLILPSVIVGCFLVSISFATAMTDWKNRWLLHIARRELRDRSEGWVDPDDSRTRFVEVVPKSVWQVRGLVENATDVGFLMVDQQNGCVSFEGDRERYWIPASALLSCSQECYSRAIRRRGAEIEVRNYFVVVRVRTSGETIAEIPFRIRMSKGLFDQDSQRRENEKLFHEIESTKHGIGVAAFHIRPEGTMETSP